MSTEREREQRRRWQNAYNAKNREESRRRQREWFAHYRKKNPDKVSAAARRNGQRRRARLAGAPASSDPEGYKAFDHYIRTAKCVKCYWCGQRIPLGRRTIDHIIPIAKGGADDVGNLCSCCSKCNSAKRDKMPEVFSGQYQIVFAPRAREIRRVPFFTYRMKAANYLLESDGKNLSDDRRRLLKILADGVDSRDVRVAQELMEAGVIPEL
jgi:5-methylcytosine-specific restriction endonuclease McrA